MYQARQFVPKDRLPEAPLDVLKENYRQFALHMFKDNRRSVRNHLSSIKRVSRQDIPDLQKSDLIRSHFYALKTNSKWLRNGNKTFSLMCNILNVDAGRTAKRMKDAANEMVTNYFAKNKIDYKFYLTYNE